MGNAMTEYDEWLASEEQAHADLGAPGMATTLACAPRRKSSRRGRAGSRSSERSPRTALGRGSLIAPAEPGVQVRDGPLQTLERGLVRLMVAVQAGELAVGEAVESSAGGWPDQHQQREHECGLHHAGQDVRGGAAGVRRPEVRTDAVVKDSERDRQCEVEEVAVSFYQRGIGWSGMVRPQNRTKTRRQSSWSRLKLAAPRYSVVFGEVE